MQSFQSGAMPQRVVKVLGFISKYDSLLDEFRVELVPVVVINHHARSAFCQCGALKGPHMCI